MIEHRGTVPGTAPVEFRGVTRDFGAVRALHGIDLRIEAGEFVTLLGPSGCGKTTALRLVAGFLVPTTGAILIGDKDVTRLPPQRRRIGMVFQDYALFPHMTVAENIGFGLVERREARSVIEEAVQSLLKIVSLEGMGSRYPSQLSGGQTQRVAVARALAVNPRVLLMDEPLGALDVKLRSEMQGELRRIQRETGVTTLYVTHDQDEAFNMSDRVAVIRDGRIIQVGSPQHIYERPRTPFVADFVGRINLLRGTWEGRTGEGAAIRLGGAHVVVVPAAKHLSRGTGVVVGVRPQYVRLAPAVGSREGLSGRVTETRYAGDRSFVTVSIASGVALVVQASGVEADAPSRGWEDGTPVQVQWDPERTLVWTEADIPAS